MKIYALILAGGMGSRMDNADKGLVHWHNRPLIDHVIERIRPQVDRIAVSANRNIEEYAARTPHVFPDARQWQHCGPLAALCTAANDLLLAQADWLLIVPCDMPLLPENLVSRCLAMAKRTPLSNAFYVETPVRQQYSVMFIRPQILQSAVPYLYSGMRTIRGWLQQQRARVVPFDDEAAFANYNTPEDLKEMP
ncbi:molybdenum cofactor guanylyltransferase MobA [Neisseria lisongii]|uniref:Molybdenum cofactor guanylyltransferase n=1 Tax=Neisseria lisongii TaxID=2912188 RepID=A0AAW5AHQ5_9NEIS|nr:molybdenum cofactor guanylyltransferase MobA [Neisseria lisongii]MCF7528694.1 molybdenum cofactor guanylyltransferase [Neisseria lisongii]MCF7529552.1 molybdenum cofactor guanylyltransferase [Neisseria lisongii]